LPALRFPPLTGSQLPAKRTEIQRDAANKSIGQALASSAAGATKAPPGVTANGTVDIARYGHVLKAGQLVGVRGVGESHDGNWQVDSVTHSIKAGSYTQRFTLTREGLGSTTPVVRT